MLSYTSVVKTRPLFTRSLKNRILRVIQQSDTYNPSSSLMELWKLNFFSGKLRERLSLATLTAVWISLHNHMTSQKAYLELFTSNFVVSFLAVCIEATEKYKENGVWPLDSLLDLVKSRGSTLRPTVWQSSRFILILRKTLTPVLLPNVQKLKV